MSKKIDNQDEEDEDIDSDTPEQEEDPTVAPPGRQLSLADYIRKERELRSGEPSVEQEFDPGTSADPTLQSLNRSLKARRDTSELENANKYDQELKDNGHVSGVLGPKTGLEDKANAIANREMAMSAGMSAGSLTPIKGLIGAKAATSGINPNISKYEELSRLLRNKEASSSVGKDVMKDALEKAGMSSSEPVLESKEPLSAIEKLRDKFKGIMTRPKESYNPLKNEIDPNAEAEIAAGKNAPPPEQYKPEPFKQNPFKFAERPQESITKSIDSEAETLPTQMAKKSEASSPEFNEEAAYSQNTDDAGFGGEPPSGEGDIQPNSPLSKKAIGAAALAGAGSGAYVANAQNKEDERQASLRRLGITKSGDKGIQNPPHAPDVQQTLGNSNKDESKEAVLPKSDVSQIAQPSLRSPKALPEQQINQPTEDKYAKLNQMIADLKQQRFMNNFGRAMSGMVASAGGHKDNFDQMYADRAKSLDKMPDEFKTQEEMESGIPKHDPNSSISKMYRDLAQSNGYTPRGNETADELEKLMPQLFKSRELKETTAARVQSQKDKLDAMKQITADRAKITEESQLEKDRQKLGDVTNFNKQARGNAAQIQNLVNQGERLQTLVDSIPKNSRGEPDLGKVTPIQKEELLRTFDTLLAGKSTVSGQQELMKSVDSIYNKAAQIRQYLTGNKAYGNESGLLKSVVDTIYREKGLAVEKIKDMSYENSIGFKRLREKDPDYVKQILKEKAQMDDYDVSLREHGFRANDVNRLLNSGYDKAEIAKMAESGKSPRQIEAKVPGTHKSKQDDTSNNMIKVQTKDGQIWNIPKDKLNDAISRGAKEII